MSKHYVRTLWLGMAPWIETSTKIVFMMLNLLELLYSAGNRHHRHDQAVVGVASDDKQIPYQVEDPKEARSYKVAVVNGFFWFSPNEFRSASTNSLTLHPHLYRVVSEVLYYVFLVGYVAGLEAHWNHSVAAGKAEGQPRPSTPTWHKALDLARESLKEATRASTLRKNDKVIESQEAADRAHQLLIESSNVAPPKRFGFQDCFDSKEVWCDL